MSEAKKNASEGIADMSMKPDRSINPQKAGPKSLRTRFLKRSVAKSLNSGEVIVSDIVRAILQIPASSDRRSLYLPITSGLRIYFTQSMKKDPNRSRVWMEYIH